MQDGSELEVKNRWRMMWVMLMCPFISTLSSSIINVGLPIMSTSLSVSGTSISWLVTVYLVVTSATILLFGKMGDLFGNIRVLQSGIMVFAVGSLLCGISIDFRTLMISRIIQAVGSGAIMANNHGIITKIFPKNERGRALGMNAAFVALGTMVGPSLGGLLLQFASWNFLFLINVPFAVTVFVLQKIFLPKEERQAAEKVDYISAALFGGFIVCLFAALQGIQRLGLMHPMILACGALAIVTFILFVMRQMRCKNPLLDLGIFKNKWFNVSLFCAFTSYLAIQTVNIILPFYFQDVLFYSPGTAGLYLSIYPMILLFAAPLSGYLSDKLGAERITLAGLLVMVIGLVSIGFLTDSTPAHIIIITMAVMAAGNGMFQAPNNTIIMSSIPKTRLGVGGSVNALTRNIGQNFGVFLSTLLLYSGISRTLGRVVDDYPTGNPAAFSNGMKLTFIVVASICGISVILTVFRMLKRQKYGEQAEPSSSAVCNACES